MTRRIPILAACVLGLGGCVIMDDGKEEGEDGPPQSETYTWAPEINDSGVQLVIPDVSVSWGDDAVALQVSDVGDWTLGMAETGGSCGSGVSCWTGEDCHLGFTASDGSTLGPYCHAISGGALSLTYGGDMTDLAEGTTVFRAAFSSTVTYVLQPADPSLPCLVFGDDPSYYSSLGCVALSR